MKYKFKTSSAFIKRTVTNYITTKLVEEKVQNEIKIKKYNPKEFTKKNIRQQKKLQIYQ